MRVESLYVFAFGGDPETLKVTLGLFHRHAPKAANALGVYVPNFETDLFQIPTLKKGNTPDLKVKTGNTNIKRALPLAPETDFTSDEEPGRRASVGMYFVTHGMTPSATAGSGAEMIARIEPVFASSGPPKVIALVRCFGAPSKNSLPSEKALPDQPSTILVEDMLVALNQRGWRPLITAWVAFVSASPATKTDIPLGAKVITTDTGFARTTSKSREENKFGYYVNGDSKIIVLPASQIRDHYLAD
jgi:hypothetical protein